MRWKLCENMDFLKESGFPQNESCAAIRIMKVAMILCPEAAKTVRL
jgi:hypothetical protein